MTSSGVAGGTPDTVPRGVDDLTPEWLTAAYLMVLVLPVVTMVGWQHLPERSRSLSLEPIARAIATIDDIAALEVFE